MIRKIIFPLFLAGTFLVSCGNDKKQDKPAPSDSTAMAVPAELKELNKEILASPNSADLYHKRATYYLNNKQYDEGLADMTRVLSIDSTKASYYMTLSDLYFAVNKSGNSKTALEKAIQLDNKNVEAYLKLAELYLYVRKNDKSIGYINDALKIDQYNAKAYFMKGMNLKELKDTAHAISSMQTAVEQDQQYYNAYMQLGLLCAAQKNRLAADYYKNAIRIQPKSGEAWYGLGYFYQQSGDYSNAIGAYITLLKFENNKNAFYNLGVIHLLKTKEYNKAAAYFTGAIDLDPKYVEAYYGRAVTYREMKDFKKEVLDLQACLSIDPKFQPAVDELKNMK